MTTRVFRSMIIGPPGSGKGTISARIADTFKIHHISTGDILRKHVANKTHLGKLVHDYLSEGSLVPDNVIHDCVMHEINKSASFLLDGYPRTITQAETLSLHLPLDCCIYLNVPFHVIIKRLSKRWTHIASGRAYNDGFHDPKVKYKDDVTGEPLEQREDDKPKAIIKRLELYESITKPVLEYYRKTNIVHEFGGKKSEDLWPLVKLFLEKALNS